MRRIITLKTPCHFCFNACLEFLNRGYDECLYEVNHEYVRRIIRISSGLTLIQVSSNNSEIIVSTNQNVTEVDIKEIKEYVIDWFDFKRDLSEFYQLLDSMSVTKEFSKEYYGLRLMGIVDLFEALCWCVIGQQINLTFAHRIKTRLVHKFGDIKSFDGKNYYCFPTPQSLINANRQTLVDMQFSKQKIAYIFNIATAFCQNEITKTELLKLSQKQQIESLLQIKGIGPWTANYVSMKTLRNMNCIAYGDTGLSSALHKLFKTEKKPNISDINKIFKPFRGWESYFNFYLWKSLS